MNLGQVQASVKRPHRSTGVGRGRMGVEAAIKALQGVPGVEIDPTGTILVPEAVVDLPARRFGPRVGTLIGTLIGLGWGTESRGDRVALAPVAEQLPQQLPSGCPSPRVRLDSINGAVAPRAEIMQGSYREKEHPPSPASGGERGGLRLRESDPTQAHPSIRPPDPGFEAMLAEAAETAGMTGLDTAKWWLQVKVAGVDRYDGLKWTDLTAADLAHALSVAFLPRVQSPVNFGVAAAYKHILERRDKAEQAEAKERAKANAQAKRAATPDGAPFRAPKPKEVSLPARPERIAEAHWQAGIDIMLWRGRGRTPMPDILSVCRVIEHAGAQRFDFGHLPVAMGEVQARMMRDSLPRKFEQVAAEVLQEVINLTRKGPAKAAAAPILTQAPPPIPEAPSRGACATEPEPTPNPMNTEPEARVSWLLATMPTGLIGSPEDSLAKHAQPVEPPAQIEAPKNVPAPKNAAPVGKNATATLPLFVGLPGSEADPATAPDAASIPDTAALEAEAHRAKIAAAKAALAYADRLALKAARAKAEAEAQPALPRAPEPVPVQAVTMAPASPAKATEVPAPTGYATPRTKAEREAAEARSQMRTPGFWRPCPEATAKLPGLLAFACTVAEHGGCPQLLYPDTMEAEVKALFTAHGGRREATQAAADELGRHARILRGYAGQGCHANPCELVAVARAA